MTEEHKRPPKTAVRVFPDGTSMLRETPQVEPCGKFEKKVEARPLPPAALAHFKRMQQEIADRGDEPNEFVEEALTRGTDREGDELVCTHHLAAAMGINEHTLSAFGLIRSDIMGVESVESLKNEDFTITRSDTCQDDWFGTCLWPLGEIVLWASTPDTITLLMRGDIESEAGVEQEFKRWTTSSSLS